MNCNGCRNPFDHSRRKPISLSCPHTFCQDCVKKLTAKQCPDLDCNATINSKFENSQLLLVIPESSYDKLRKKIEKNLIQTDQLQLDVSKNWDKENFNYTKSLRDEIENTADQLILLIKTNKQQLLNDVFDHEDKMNETFCKIKAINDVQNYLKTKAASEDLNEKELADLDTKIEAHVRQLNFFSNQSSSIKNESIKFAAMKSISSETGIFGELVKKSASHCLESKISPKRYSVASSSSVETEGEEKKIFRKKIPFNMSQWGSCYGKRFCNCNDKMAQACSSKRCDNRSNKIECKSNVFV